MPAQCRVYIRRLFLTIHPSVLHPSIHATGYAEIPSLRFLCAAPGKSSRLFRSVSLSFTPLCRAASAHGECLLHERPLIMPALSRQLIIRPRLPEYLSYSSQKFQPISISTPLRRLVCPPERARVSFVSAFLCFPLPPRFQGRRAISYRRTEPASPTIRAPMPSKLQSQPDYEPRSFPVLFGRILPEDSFRSSIEINVRVIGRVAYSRDSELPGNRCNVRH